MHCTAAGALSWQQMTVLANAFKSASSSDSSSSRVLLSEAAEVMLKVGTGASVLPFPWQASSPQSVISYSSPFIITATVYSMTATTAGLQTGPQ